MGANGNKFASLGPFKVVFKPITFQRLCASLHGSERGKPAHALQVRPYLIPRLRWKVEAEDEVKVQAKSKRGKSSLNLNLDLNLLLGLEPLASVLKPPEAGREAGASRILSAEYRRGTMDG